MLALLLAVVLPNDCKTRRNDLKPTVFAFLYCIWYASRSPILFSLLSFPYISCISSISVVLLLQALPCWIGSSKQDSWHAKELFSPGSLNLPGFT